MVLDRSDIKDELEGSFGNYVVEVMLNRAVPFVEDGLKPVQRRILYGEYKMGNLPTKPTVKSARVVGEIMGKYHPHGDCLYKSTLLRLLNGEIITIEEAYKRGETIEVLGINQKTGEIIPVKAHSFRIGQYANKIYKVRLVNGYEIKATSNHPFRLTNGDWVKAEDLKPNMILDYGCIYDSKDHLAIKGQKTKNKMIHDIVYSNVNVRKKGNVIHHIDFDVNNNTLENLDELTRGDHAKLHGDYVKGLSNGLYSMFNPLGKDYDKTKEKNSVLVRQLNKNTALVKANANINRMRKDGKQLTLANYESYRDSVYNLPYIDRMITKGIIGSFEELVIFNESNPSFINYVKNDFVEKEHVGGRLIKNTMNPVMYLSHFIKAAERSNYTLSFEELTVKTDVYKDFLPLIESITVEEVDNEPMYDFTVDAHENMLICGNETGDLLVCVHNSSIYDALARLSKEWVVREPLVYMHGNNGSIDGDGAAAMRYTECRLSPLAMEMLNGLSKRDTVDWQLTFDDTDHEPVLLPAKFPNILVNGSSGIGVGYATDIPTHNLTEVLEATIKLVENPNASLEEIVAVLPAPDFPTGGIIVGAKTLKDTYALGNGSVKLRGRYHTEVDKSKLLIVFDEIPYGAEKPKMVEKIQSIIENKQLHGLLAVADESGKDGLRFVLTCRKDVDPKVITSYLFKTTDLQKSIKMNMLMIANGKPRQLGVIAILNYFNQFRRSTIIRELNYDLKVDKANLHLYEGFLKMTDHIDEIIQMIKESNSKSESRDKLMSTLEFSELQANKILELQLHRISSADKDEFQAKFDAAEKSIKTLERVLSNDKLISKLMIKQYKELITKYGNARKTSIEYEEEEVTIEKLDIISLDEVVVGINADGFIKRSSLRSYQATEMEDNFLALKTDTHKSIIAFTNKGRYYFTPVHKLEDNKWNSQGKHLNTLGVALEDNEVFITISEYNEKLDYLLVKSNGIMKLGEAKDLVVSRVTKMYDCGHVKDEEEVIYAGLIDPKANFGVVTNKKKAMRFSLEDFGETGLKAIGKKAINLGKLSKILSVGIVEEQFPLRAVGQSATFSESYRYYKTKCVVPNQIPEPYIHMKSKVTLTKIQRKLHIKTADEFEAERLEKERIEQERIEQERIELERLEQERIEQESLENSENEVLNSEEISVTE